MTSTSSTTIYEFRVDGCLPEHCREAFCGMQLEEVPSGLILRGPVIDQSHLLGIVSELRVMGVSLVSMRPSNRQDNPAARSTSRLPTGTRTRRTRRLLRRPL
jgi:hypothetical protein